MLRRDGPRTDEETQPVKVQKLKSFTIWRFYEFVILRLSLLGE